MLVTNWLWDFCDVCNEIDVSPCIIVRKDIFTIVEFLVDFYCCIWLFVALPSTKLCAREFCLFIQQRVFHIFVSNAANKSNRSICVRTMTLADHRYFVRLLFFQNVLQCRHLVVWVFVCVPARFRLIVPSRVSPRQWNWSYSDLSIMSINEMIPVSRLCRVMFFLCYKSFV